MSAENINVEVGPHPDGGENRAAVVKDQVGGRCWSGEGRTDSEATTQAVRKFLGDRRSPEYVNTKG